MLYFIILFIIAVVALLDFTTMSKKERAILYILGMALFIILGGIRWKTGSDWFNYAYYFFRNTSWAEYSGDTSFEFGYKVLNYLVKSIINSYSVFLLFITFIAVSLKAFFFYKNFNYILLCLLGFFCFFQGDIFTTRQTIAISLCIVSTIFIANRKPLGFIIMVLAASLVHNTAILYLISYFVYYRRMNNLTLASLLLIAIVIGASGIINKLLGPLGTAINILGSNGSRMSEKIETYSKMEVSGKTSNISGTTNLIFGVARRMFVLPIFFLMRKRVEKEYPVYSHLLNLFVFGNIIYFVFSSSIIIFARAAYYYAIFEICLIVLIMQVIRSNHLKLLTYLVFLLYCFFKLYGSLSNYWDLYNPFYTIFDTYIDRKLY